MFLSLEVENFRSIKERQTLTFRRAGNGSESRLDFGSDTAGGDFTPVVVLFGANASGKSNVLDALKYVRALVLGSADRKVGKPLPVQTFRLDKKSREAPSSFRIRFSTAMHEYEYEVSLQDGKVVSEWLGEHVRNTTRRSVRTLFARRVADGKSAITVSAKLRGSKKAIIDATRDNMLFLSKAAKENFEPLMDAYHWFIPEDSSTDPVNLFDEDPKFCEWVLQLLGSADLGVSDIRIKPPSQRPPQELVKMLAEGDDSKSLADVEQRLMKANRQPTLSHRAIVDGVLTAAEIPWNYESLGTQQLWRYAGGIYSALKNGTLLLLDEITGLHPLLLKEIITLFQRKSTNPNGAQLLFSSHDVTLLSNWGGLGFLLDRDQIWFTEKGNDGITQLYPLTDFSPRSEENIEKLYLQGRLGATPILGDLVREAPRE